MVPVMSGTQGHSRISRNRSTKDGFANYCKPCHNRIMRANRLKHHGSTRSFHLKRRYGIDDVTVNWLVLQQKTSAPSALPPGPITSITITQPVRYAAYSASIAIVESPSLWRTRTS
jgi:hypothetical protein